MGEATLWKMLAVRQVIALGLAVVHLIFAHNAPTPELMAASVTNANIWLAAFFVLRTLRRPTGERSE